jgi:hypothetical protein
MAGTYGGDLLRKSGVLRHFGWRALKIFCRGDFCSGPLELCIDISNFFFFILGQEKIKCSIQKRTFLFGDAPDFFGDVLAIITPVTKLGRLE